MAVPIEIEIWQGEIAELEVDALVIPANESLFMTTAVAGAVKRHAGDDVEREAVEQGPIRVGQVVVTAGGRLAAPYVIHAAAVGHDLRRDPAGLRSAVQAALEAVERLALRRVAIAPLGAERGVFPPAEAAEIMIAAIGDHAEHGTGSPENVVVAVTQSEELTAYGAALEAYLARAAARPPAESA